MTIRCFLKVNEHTKLALATTFSAELLCSFFELVQLLPVVASPFILVILQFPVLVVQVYGTSFLLLPFFQYM